MLEFLSQLGGSWLLAKEMGPAAERKEERDSEQGTRADRATSCFYLAGDLAQGVRH